MEEKQNIQGNAYSTAMENCLNTPITIKQESSDAILNDTSTLEYTLSSWNSESDTSSGEITNNDLFEGSIYRTHLSEATISINFVSGVFFERFKNKIHADYMSSIDIDNTNFISKCTTHIKGARCDIKLDSHFKTVDLSGLGCKIWRNERFPQISRSLFKRLMYDLDSQMEGFSQCEFGTGDDTGIYDQLDTSKSGAEKQTTDVNVAPESDVAQSGSTVPSRDVTLHSDAGSTEQRSGVTDNINIVGTETSSLSPQPSSGSPIQAANDMSNSEMRASPEFTAENITDEYMQSLKIAKNQRQEINLMIDAHPLTENQDMADKKQDSDRHNLDCQGLMASSAVLREIPAFTSTPITQRQEVSVNNGTASQTMRVILNRIDELDSGIKAIKRDILQQMEYKLDALKTSFVSLIERMSSKKNYADVTRIVDQTSLSSLHNITTSSNTDEGYGDQSTANIRSSSSETQLKVPYVPNISKRIPPQVLKGSQNQGTAGGPRLQPVVESTDRSHSGSAPALVNGDSRTRTITTPQPVPVHITNRNQIENNNRERNGLNQSIPTSPKSLKTLIVGDSLLKGINSKGLENGVRICSKNGAKIKDIWDEIAVYDMKSFQNIILCVGGNDGSSGTETGLFEEKYDELVGYIKAANNDCAVYLCKVVPRGDVDVSGINTSIERVANHWRMHHVKLITSTNELFFGADGMPCGRYYSNDGIHCTCLTLGQNGLLTRSIDM